MTIEPIPDGLLMAAKPVTFGARLREILTERGLTAYRLGKDAGIAHQTLGDILAERSQPSWPLALRIADALGVSTETFRN